MVKISDRKSHLKKLETLYAKALLNRPKINDLFLSQFKLERNEIFNLNKNNFLKLENFFNVDELNNLTITLEDAFNKPDMIQRPRKLPLNSKKNGDYSVEELEKIEKINDEELEMGPEFWKNITSSISLKSPCYHFPQILDFVLDPRILSLAQEYLGEFPALTYLKVTKTWANNLPDFDTQLWHVDFDAAKMLKLFIFLHDINTERGGTRFIMNTHLFDPNRNYELQDRYTEAEVSNIFPSQNIVTAEGVFGDAFLLDTNLLHRGVRPVNKDRLVIIANYSIHEETMSDGNLDYDQDKIIKLHPIQKFALSLK